MSATARTTRVVPEYRIPNGSRVMVTEPGIQPRGGIVTMGKFSHVSGWNYEVRYDHDGMTRVVGYDYVREETL